MKAKEEEEAAKITAQREKEMKEMEVSNLSFIYWGTYSCNEEAYLNAYGLCKSLEACTGSKAALKSKYPVSLINWQAVLRGYETLF